MSANDIQVIKGAGSVRSVRVDDRDTSSASQLNAGEPIKKGGAGGNFAILVATGDPEIATDTLLGVTTKASTETAAADGIVEYISVNAGQTVLRGKATTATNMDTDAELLGLEGDYVTFDVTAGAVTINENEGSDPDVHGLKILTGNIVDGTLDVLVHVAATEAGTTDSA